MALKNRTEAKAVVNLWSAILDLELNHKPDLQEVLNNCLFRKDIATSTTASGTTKTLEFLDVDYIEVTQSNNVAYTLNNVQQGEIKYLKITKSAAQTISFVNGTDVSNRKSFIDLTTVVIYRIINKDSNLYIESINIDNEQDLITKIVDIGDWNMDTTKTINVAHGISDFTKIRRVSVMIRNDPNTNLNPINAMEGTTGTTIAGSVWFISSTDISITRLTGGIFDNTFYDSTSYNRGWITIEYIR